MLRFSLASPRHFRLLRPTTLLVRFQSTTFDDDVGLSLFDLVDQIAVDNSAQTAMLDKRLPLRHIPSDPLRLAYLTETTLAALEGLDPHPDEECTAADVNELVNAAVTISCPVYSTLLQGRTFDNKFRLKSVAIPPNDSLCRTSWHQGSWSNVRSERHSVLERCAFRGMVFEGCVFDCTILDGSIFFECSFVDTVFTRCSLRRCVFHRCVLASDPPRLTFVSCDFDMAEVVLPVKSERAVKGTSVRDWTHGVKNPLNWKCCRRRFA